MARRSHYSFNKRQKELKQKEKAEKKMQRRLAKKAGDNVDQDAEGGSAGVDATDLQSADTISEGMSATDNAAQANAGEDTTRNDADDERVVRDNG